MYTKPGKTPHDHRETVADAEGEPITIQIKMNGTTYQNFRIAKSVLTAAAVLTVVSALWGAGMAWWMAWNEISGLDSQRELARAKLVADEVTKSISANGVLAKSERDLLAEIRDAFSKFVPSAFSGRAGTAESVESDQTLADEKRRERSVWARLASGKRMMVNLPVRGLEVPEPMKLESASYFRLRDSDVFRIDLAHNKDKLVSGEISVIGKYKVGDVEIIVGCCGEVKVTDSGDASVASGVQFRAMFRARKHIEISRTDGARLVAVKIGVLTSSHPSAQYTRWIPVEGLKSEDEALAVQVDPPTQLPKRPKYMMKGKIPVQEMERTFKDDLATEHEADIRHFPGDEGEAYDEMASSTAQFNDSGSESPLSNAMRILSKLRPAAQADDSEY